MSISKIGRNWNPANAVAGAPLVLVEHCPTRNAPAVGSIVNARAAGDTIVTTVALACAIGRVTRRTLTAVHAELAQLTTGMYSASIKRPAPATTPVAEATRNTVSVDVIDADNVVEFGYVCADTDAAARENRIARTEISFFMVCVFTPSMPFQSRYAESSRTEQLSL